MIELQHLRDLTVDARKHPRGQPHLSAASGLVCAHRRAYVIADDEHHLAVFRDARSAGELSRLFEGDLPLSKTERKQLKPDLETLLALPACATWPNGALFAIGSGSRPNRQTGVVIELDAEGAPAQAVRYVDLRPMYEELHRRFDELNIEGAIWVGETFVLLQRGNAGGSSNASVQFRRADALALICGESAAALQPMRVQDFDLGSVAGVPLGFTDGAALPDGRWVFTAVAENTHNSFDDGACGGAAIGLVDADGGLAMLQRLDPPHKVEGIAARVAGSNIELCLVSDSDDPTQPSAMYLAVLPDPG